MRRVALLVVVVLLAAACSSTSKTDRLSGVSASAAPSASASGDASAPDGSQPPDARGDGSGAGTGVAPGASAKPSADTRPGVAKTVTGPIEIGFLNTGVGNAAAAGLSTGESQPPADVFLGLVKAMNARGGFAGRRIVPVVADTDTATARWETDYQAACAEFTQDHHVSAVLGYSFAMIESFESCLTKAGAVHLTGGYSVGDEKTLDDNPGMFATSNPTVDRRYRVQVSSAVADGFVKTSNKLGLVLDDCPEDWRAYNRTLLPYIKQAKLNVVATSVLACPDGAADASALVQQLNNAVLQFRAKGVDRVFIEGIPFIFFANTAEGQGWAPGYLLTSTTSGAVLDANPVPKRQLAKVHGAGWLPYLDVSASKQPPRTEPQQRCLSLLKSVGVVVSQYNDFVAAYTTCDAMFLYERALQATRGVSTASVVRGAIEALGTTYAGVTSHVAKTGFGPGDHDAVAVYRPWTWRADCACFLYTGGPKALR